MFKSIMKRFQVYHLTDEQVRMIKDHEIQREHDILRDGGWRCMEEAPKDHLIEVMCPGRQGLLPLIHKTEWHPDAGFCVDELREPVMWRFPRG